MSDKAIEQEIQAKGLNAPRIKPDDIKANIVGEYYFTASEGVQAALHKQDELTRLTGAHGELALLTFCVLVLKNGFTVTGESACASPENFDEEIGRRIARENAVAKVWPLMGYELRSKLAARAEFGQSEGGEA
ncbi:Gp49 family protein [Pseudomonas sp. NY11955]|uniref:Gp49 family protein n=1 Tax=Pseudomonas sp. NY11955 TaxID=3400363 RepID=UPI003A8604FE